MLQKDVENPIMWDEVIVDSDDEKDMIKEEEDAFHSQNSRNWIKIFFATIGLTLVSFLLMQTLYEEPVMNTI